MNGIKKSKYGNKKVLFYGKTFDSQKEGYHYLKLRSLLKAKKIKNLILQPKYMLQEPFDHKGKRYRAIIYKADFQFENEKGEIIVQDVKGYKTEVYKLKKKLLLKTYPQINFMEV